MTLTLVIERVDYSDSVACDTLVRLLDNYAGDPMGGGKSLSDFTKQHLAESLAAIEGAVSLLARLGDKPVGFTNCFQGFSTFACAPILNIHDIAVDASYRGQGIASRLLEEVARIATDRGCCKVTLEVLVGNEIAKRVYHTAGFNPAAMHEAAGPYEFWEKPL